jgi:hypothetical protein
MLPPRLTGPLAIAAAAALCLQPGHAQTLDFVPFETGGVSDIGVLDPIDLNALLIQTEDGLQIEIRNDSRVGNDWITPATPTITRIYFELDAGLPADPVIVDTTGQVLMDPLANMNLPGGRNISFQSTTAFRARPAPVFNGVSPGESVNILLPDTTIDDLLAGSGARIGLHVQQIGPNAEDSASFAIPEIPEPGIALLATLSLLAALRRRR